ncbi:MAG: SpvB/TcaC N-terminal domain-containing protein [Nanoarchaeota archaeon]
MKKEVIISGLLLLVAIISTTIVFADDPADAFYRPFVQSVVPESISNNLNLKESSFDVSLFSGEAIYSYTLEVPPGTNGLSPTVNLIYRSHDTKSKPDLIGSAWSITQNYIQRNINYTQKDSSDDYFQLHLNDNIYDLVYDSSTQSYHTKIESFLNIKNSTGGNNTQSIYWIVKTRDGTMYRFGFNNDSEQISDQESYINRWYLDLINDTYNNGIFYSYLENPNNNDIGITYPYKIEYNNDKERIIEFILESSDRNDTYEVYSNGNKERYLYKTNIRFLWISL